MNETKERRERGFAFCPIMSRTDGAGGTARVPCDPRLCMLAVELDAPGHGMAWACGLNTSIPYMTDEVYFNMQESGEADGAN